MAGKRGDRFIYFVIIILILIFSVAPVFAQSRPNTVVIGGSHDYPPYSFRDERGEAVGFAVDLSRAMADVLNINVSIDLRAWSEVLAKLTARESHLVHDIVVSEQRAQTFSFSAPYHMAPYIVFAKQDAPVVEEPEDLNGKRIAVVKGDIGQDYLSENGISGTFHFVDDYPDAIALVEQGDYDYTLMDNLVGLYWIRELGAKNVTATNLSLLQLRYAFGALPENYDILLALNGALPILIETGEFGEIYDRWMGPLELNSSRLGEWVRLFFPAFLGVGALALILLLWSWTLRQQVKAKTAQLQTELGRRKQSEEHLQLTLLSIGDAVISTDSYGNVSAMNPVAEELTGWKREDARGRPLTEVFDIFNSKTGMRAQNPVDTVMKTGAIVGLANHTSIRAKHGGERHIADSAAPILDEDGVIRGVILVFRDVTSQYESEEAIRQSETRFRSLFENSISPVALQEVILDEDARAIDVRFLEVNEAFAALIGKNIPDIVGKNWTELFATLDSERIRAYEEVATTGVSIQAEEYFEEIDKHLDVKVYRAAPNQIVSLINDISERKEFEAAQREWHHMMQYIVHHDPNAIAVLDKELRHIFVSRRFLQDYGVEERAIIGKNHYEVFPDIPEEWKQIHRRALAGEVLEGTEDEYRRQDGTIDYTRWECRPWHHVDGSMGGIVLYTEVITERKRAEEALRHSEEYFRSIVELMPDVIMRYNLDGVVQDIRSSSQRPLSRTREQIIGRKLDDLMHQDVVGELMDGLKGALDKHKRREIEYSVLRTSGKLEWYEARILPTEEREGVALVRDITTRKHAEEKLKELTFNDSLTGLYNRRFLEEEIERLDTPRQLPISLIMADVNGLKIVNDSLGHQKGDQLLKTAARIITDACRHEDIVARWGGDEYVVLLPNTSADQAEAICSRIQAAADNSGDRPVRLSISTGSATKHEEGQNILEILREAEDYMYRHKSMNTKSSRSALVTSLQRTLEEKSHETQQHAENMRNLAVALGRKCRFTERDSNELALLAILHDLGKVAIPEQILTKTGPLTDEEWQVMRKHPEIGHRIALASPDLVAVADGILSHHERFDGAGYPRGLKGTDIPLSARIVAIVDTFEAMTSDRPYRKGVSVAEALEEIHACAGFQFDPNLVTLFLEMMHESEAASTTEESS